MNLAWIFVLRGSGLLIFLIGIMNSIRDPEVIYLSKILTGISFLILSFALGEKDE